MKSFIRNILYDTWPVVVHYPSLGERESRIWRDLEMSRVKVRIKLPDDLTIVTWNNSSRLGFLEQQLVLLGVDYLRFGDGITTWRNSHKIHSFLERYQEIKTKYVLALDCYDVILTGDLGSVMENFFEMKSEVVFNAADFGWPRIESEMSKEEELCSDRPFCYMNAGALIGNAVYLRDFYVAAISNATYEHPRLYQDTGGSDQFLLRRMYHKRHPEVSIDSQCRIFQVLNASNYCLRTNEVLML